jgi:hypothetical protein
MHTVLFFCLLLTVLIYSGVTKLSNIFSPYFVEAFLHYIGAWQLKIKGYFNEFIIYLIILGLYIQMRWIFCNFLLSTSCFWEITLPLGFEVYINQNWIFSSILWENLPYKNPQKSVICLERRNTLADQYDLLPCVLWMHSVHKQNGKGHETYLEKKMLNTRVGVYHHIKV